MTRGLRNDPERYLETYWSRWPDVWVHGDWASIEEVDGRTEWFLHGRSDDTIKVAGKRLGPGRGGERAGVAPRGGGGGRRRPARRAEGRAALGLRRARAPAPSRPRSCAPSSSPWSPTQLGKSFQPAGIRFVARAARRPRSAKVVRRVVRAVATGTDPGDLSSLEDPGALDAIREAS